MQGLSKSGLVVARARAGKKLGYHWQRELAPLFSAPVKPDPSSLHVVDQYVDVARAAGAECDRADFGMQPSEEEQAQMQEAQANVQPDAQTMYLMAEAQKSEALARKADADTQLTMANAEKAKADTLSILSEIENPTNNTRTEVKVEQVDPIKQERELLDIESKRFDLAIKMRQLEEIESKVDTVKAQITAAQSLSEASQNITSAVSGIDSGVAGFKEAVDAMSKTQREATEAALKAVNRPKKLIREKGKIVGIE
jgi:hypothetical protein